MPLLSPTYRYVQQLDMSMSHDLGPGSRFPPGQEPVDVIEGLFGASAWSQSAVLAAPQRAMRGS